MWRCGREYDQPHLRHNSDELHVLPLRLALALGVPVAPALGIVSIGRCLAEVIQQCERPRRAEELDQLGAAGSMRDRSHEEAFLFIAS